MLVTPLLVVGWIGLFVVEARLGSDSRAALLAALGVHPDRVRTALAGLLHGELAGGWTDVLAPLLAHQLLHAGPLHLLVDCAFVWVFGSRLEARAGRWRFAAFFFSAGAVAGVAHAYLASGDAPAVGGNGAVAACVGAFLALYGRSWILVAAPVIVVPVVVEVPSLVLAGAFFALQIRPIETLLAVGGAVPVAWLAQVCGFGAGFVLLPLIAARRSKRSRARRR